MLRIRRGGRYFRVADPGWHDPLDGRFAEVSGGRWNAPGSFPVVYLNRSIAVARANVYRRLAGQPYGPEDLHSATAPILIETGLPRRMHVDVVTDEGCVAAGLPRTYPLDSRGAVVAHGRCRAVGQAAWDARAPGVACRSAARAAPSAGEELAWFQREGRRLEAAATDGFEDWFWEPVR